MNLYIDESGIITKKKAKHLRYFIISFMETNDPRKVAKIFERSKKAYITHNPDCGLSFAKEIKGSEMPNEMKKYIFENLRDKTDLKTHFIIFDNWNGVERLLKKPSIAFNYLVYLKIFSIIKNRPKIKLLKLKLDNRNCAVYGLKSLQEYLEIEFCLKKTYCSDIRVKYHDSKNKELIQIADIFSNTLFKVCKYNDEENPKLKKHYKDNMEILKIIEKGHWESFPRKYCNFEFIN